MLAAYGARAAGDYRARAAQIAQHHRERLAQSRFKYAEKLQLRAGRIGQRPEQIEDGADTQFPPHRRHMLHAGMV